MFWSFRNRRCIDDGMTCQHGLDHTYLKRFDKVYSGHFHQKSEVKEHQVSWFSNAIHMVRLWR